MPRVPVAAVAVLLASLAAGAQQPVPPFTTRSDLVVVPTVVVDQKGDFVRGLTIDQFQVSEDGRPVTIEAFVAPESEASRTEGRFLVLVLDNLNIFTERAYRVQDIARRFADRLEPRDAVSVIALSGGRSFTAMSRQGLLAAIDRFRPAFGDTISTRAQDAAHGLRTIGDLARQMSAVNHRRKVLVFIGAASMFSPHEPSPFDSRGPGLGPDWLEAVRSTGRDNVSVYAIDPMGFSGSVHDYSQGFAEETGGQAWVNTNNFSQAVDTIWRDSATYYLLGYAAPINDHRLHKIEVRVTVPQVTVRARKARG